MLWNASSYFSEPNIGQQPNNNRTMFHVEYTFSQQMFYFMVLFCLLIFWVLNTASIISSVSYVWSRQSFVFFKCCHWFLSTWIFTLFRITMLSAMNAWMQHLDGLFMRCTCSQILYLRKNITHNSTFIIILMTRSFTSNGIAHKKLTL